MSDTQQEVEEQKEGYGSIEKGIAGHFHFSISEIINESWERTKGNKGNLWLSFIIFIVIYAIGAVILKGAFKVIGYKVPEVPELAFDYIAGNFVVDPILMAVVTAPLTAGIWRISIKIATEKAFEPTEIAKYFPQIVKLFLTYLAMYSMILVGYFLFILPGIYLSVAYFLVMPLVVEKNMSIWQAMETSRKAINHVWFSVFGLYILFGLMAVAAIFTLGIGYIWLFPMVVISYGVIYRIIFGIESSVIVDA